METICLHYELGPQSRLAQLRFRDAPRRRAFRREFLTWMAVIACVGLVGMIPSLRHPAPWPLLVLSVVLVVTVGSAAAYGGFYARSLARSALAFPPQAVTLEIDDAGLRERVAGVESFAPWQAVRGVELFERTVLVELASGQWCLIPVAVLAPWGESVVGDLQALARAAAPAAA